MAVLVEAISVIIRVQAIQERYEGGWTSFVRSVPNQTLCSDNELARIGFMAPDDCKAFVDSLDRVGIAFVRNGQSQEIVIADQMHGFTVPCEWADYGRVEISQGQTVSAAQLKGSSTRQVYCPEGWKYEGSLSQQFEFVPSGKEEKSLRFLRHEQGLDVYLNMVTGKQVYIGRTGGHSEWAQCIQLFQS
jgi:hypothetical protein